MRRFLFLGIAVCVGLGVWLQNLDLASYRPGVQSWLGGKLGFPLQADRIRFHWIPAMGLVLQGFEFIGPDPSKPLLKAERASFLLKPQFFRGPLLDFRVDSLELEGADIFVSSRADGPWNRALARRPAGLSSVIFQGVRLHGLWERKGGTPVADVLEFPRARWSRLNRASSWRFHGFVSLEAWGMPEGVITAYYDSADESLDTRLHTPEGEVDLWVWAAPTGNRREIMGKVGLLRFSLSSSLLEGTVTARFDGEGEWGPSLDWERHVKGKGSLDIRKGVWKQENWVRVILEKVGVPEGVSGPVLGGEATPFDLFQAGVVWEGGKVVAHDVRIHHREYAVQMQFTVDLTDKRAVQGTGQLVLFEGMSQTLWAASDAWSAYRNDAGRIVIPFVLRGWWPQFAVGVFKVVPQKEKGVSV